MQRFLKKYGNKIAILLIACLCMNYGKEYFHEHMRENEYCASHTKHKCEHSAHFSKTNISGTCDLTQQVEACANNIDVSLCSCLQISFDRFYSFETPIIFLNLFSKRGPPLV